MTKVLLNAFHSTTGGGVTYLRGILPLLAAMKDVQWTLLAPAETLAKVKVPAGVQVWQAPAYGFVKGHMWEQLVLPFAARRRGFRAMLCNANFVPLLARNPLPVLHTTASARPYTRGHLGAWYWWALKLLTMVGVVRAPVVFSLSNLMVREYTPGPLAWVRRKMLLAPPGLPEMPGGKAKRHKGLVMAIGDYYAQKNYPTLLQAMALVRHQRPDVRLELVGKPVYPAVAAEMQRLIAQLNLGDVVELVEDISHPALMKRLAEADVFVSASLVESFNIPMMEAMRMGVPVVCVDAPYVVDVAGDAALPVEANKGGDIPAALAVAMYGVMENASVRDLLIRRGKARAEGLTWEATVATLRRGLEKVIG